MARTLASSAFGNGLYDLSDELRTAAKDRKGDWVVIVYERTQWRSVETWVTFTADEWKRVHSLVQFAMRTELKAKTAGGNFESAATTLWPTGSVEHTAMRFLGFPAATRFICGASVMSRRGRAVGALTCGLYTPIRRAELLSCKSALQRKRTVSYLRNVWGLVKESTVKSWGSSGKTEEREIPGFIPTGWVAAVDDYVKETYGVDVDAWRGTEAGILEQTRPAIMEPKDAPKPSQRKVAPEGLQVDTGVAVETEYHVPREANAALDSQRHVHTCVSCKKQYAHQHSGGLVKHGQCKGQCPNPACARYGKGADRTLSEPYVPPEGVEVKGSKPASSVPEPAAVAAPPVVVEKKPDGGRAPAPLREVDADVSAVATEDCRTAIIGEVVGVVGNDFDQSGPKEQWPVVGALVAPVKKKPNVYSQTCENLEAAISERITKKQKECKWTPEDKRNVGDFVSASMSSHAQWGLFSKAAVQDWAIKNFDLELIKSGKWSTERFRASLENLYNNLDPQFRPKAAIKLECMPEGKAPRMLIADGDDGQLMALASISCFEHILFHHFESKSIKHSGKRDAVFRVMKEMCHEGVGIIEGDGSAWDTTCTHHVRECVENPVIEHITNILVGYGVCPAGWLQAHTALNGKQKLNLLFKEKTGKTMKVTIDSIRRSGHRGTSCLNWWTNFVLWSVSVFGERARGFLDPAKRREVDVTGVRRWWFGAFEGDDSCCGLKPHMKEGDSLAEKFLSFWDRAGFNMKIVFCRDRATFVGWHIACVDGEMRMIASPEVPRAMESAGVSTSSSAILAAREGDIETIRKIAAASAMARAFEFAGIMPSISRKFLEYAQEVHRGDLGDREMSMRALGEEGHSKSDLARLVEEKNLPVTEEHERETLASLGCAATTEEMDAFRSRVWSLEPAQLLDYDGFVASLPASWR